MEQQKEFQKSDVAEESGWADDGIDVEVDENATDICNDEMEQQKEFQESDVAEESGWADDDIDVEVDENTTDICNDEMEQQKEFQKSDVAEESGWADDGIDVEVDENTTDICNDEMEQKAQNGWADDDDLDVDIEAEIQTPNNDELSVNKTTPSLPDGHVKDQSAATNGEESGLRSVSTGDEDKEKKGSSDCVERMHVWSNGGE